MKVEHIILRGDGAFNQDKFVEAVARGTVAADTALRMEVEELDTRQLSAVKGDASVVAVAPVIPMQLIAPRDVQQAASPSAGEPTWGVDAVGATTSPFSGEGIVVAVLDTGIDAAHPAFAGAQILQKDFTGEGDGDSHGHGTHCAGTIFGRDASSGRIGIARGVKRVLVGKVLGMQGGGSSEQIVSAIQWAADNGANVVSMSLGIDFPGFVAHLQAQGFPPELAASRALEGYRENVQLFEKLAAFMKVRGAFSQNAMLIVAAAGNESDRDVNPEFEVGVSPIHPS
ncbi:S8 family serine peptidase [Cupriavidus sp. AcVe19-1a]|uniref:S8 family serine peptidase n=1 Tax=Cupriavidus sp. AcVe19-1a TaxID=2821359 RepID=UPI001AE58CAD|nr:S8 family serine peptidase [Cupriavidus sp. AcVe19-1a]MBP0633720.1 S8 family serine peptidase [Cupriavidus sp. AcVe19-1a]